MESLVGPLILVFCLGMLVLSLRRARIRSRHSERVRSGPLYGAESNRRAPGSAGSIPDGGQIPAAELLAALRETDAPEIDAEGELDGVSGLGLKLIEGSITEQLPQVMYGNRAGGQAFIRQGLVGDSITPGLRLRRMRTITVVRVESPAFEARFRDGRIEPDEQTPPPLREMLEALSESPDVWREGRLVAGPKGIVVSRAAADDYLGGWIYDLWLLEAITARAGAPALKPIRLNRGWKPPYGLDDWAPGLLERE